MQEMQIQSLSLKDPLEKEMVTHSSILAWEIPWTEEPGGLQSGLQKNQTWLSDYKQQQQLKLECTSEMSELSSLQLREMNLSTSPQYFLCVLTLPAFKEID